MYRLLIYGLVSLLILAILLSALGFLSYSPIGIISSTVFLVIVSWIINFIFSKVFEAPSNGESVYITALILALIITPATDLNDFIFLAWAATLAMVSKYILTFNKKTLFNPAAIAVVLTNFGFLKSASWWVGNQYLIIPEAILGYLIVKKIQKEVMVATFLIVAILASVLLAAASGTNLPLTLNHLVLHSAIIFLATIMLTEPQTTPPTKNFQIIYGVIVGLLFPPQLHFGSLYSTPELSLIIGNVFSFLVSPKEKLLLHLKERIKLSDNIIDFNFEPKKKLNYLPGQYLEWTLPHIPYDSRGVRRYFTLASSPTEKELKLGVKFAGEGSSFKRALLNMDSKTVISAGALGGEFILPKDQNLKLVFLAGGIGVTPFRSMIKYLLDTDQKRDIILFYSASNPEDFVYKDIFNQARRQLGTKVIYSVGRITPEIVTEQVPDFKERVFYISGPQTMVDSFEKSLRQMGVFKTQIKKDFFPGF